MQRAEGQWSPRSEAPRPFVGHRDPGEAWPSSITFKLTKTKLGLVKHGLFTFISLCLLSAEFAEQRNAHQWKERGMRDNDPLIGISAQVAHSCLRSRPHLSLHQTYS